MQNAVFKLAQSWTRETANKIHQNGNSGKKMAKNGHEYRHATQEPAAKRPGRAKGHRFAPLPALCPPRPFCHRFR